MKRRIVQIAVVVIVLAIVVVVALSVQRRSDESGVVAVRRGEISTTVDALGRVTPKEQAQVAPLVSGVVVQVYVQEGDQVSEGDLLVQLDTSDAQQALEQAQRALALQQAGLAEALAAPDAAAVRLAKARLRRATAARRVAQSDYDKIADSEDAEDSDEALDLEVAKLEYEIADAGYDQVMAGQSDLDLERIRADLYAVQVRVAQAQRQLERTRLVAPVSGTVLDVSAEGGLMAYAGNRLITLADLTQYEIMAEIDELDVAFVVEGQQVEIRLDAFPGVLVTGEVERILPDPIDDRGATAYAAVIGMNVEELALRPGMGANLKIISQVVVDALLVPRRAVEQAGQFHYVRIREGRKEIQVQVEVGLSSDTEIEILSGLTEGMLVIVD